MRSKAPYGYKGCHRWPDSEDNIVAMYEGGMSLAAIGHEFFCEAHTIESVLIRKDCPRRSRTEGQRAYWRHYGGVHQ